MIHRLLSVVLSVIMIPATTSWAAVMQDLSSEKTETNAQTLETTVATRPVTRRPASRAVIPLVPEFSDNPTPAEFFQVRLFDETLIPVGSPTPDENAALAVALSQFAQRKDREDYSALERFLTKQSKSAWKPALLLNLGIEWRKAGYFSRAMGAWKTTWNLTKNEAGASAKALADRAFGELIQINAWVGRYESIEPLLEEAGDRVFVGGATEMVSGARHGLWIMKNTPERGFMCGPAAIYEILTTTTTNADLSHILAARSTTNGFNLEGVKELAEDCGLSYQMARRGPGASIPLHSVVHWKLNHYGVIVDKRDGQYLIQDGTFSRLYGQKLWISSVALDEESSGYFLIPDDAPRIGWDSVSLDEGRSVWGKGPTSGHDESAFTPYDEKSCENGGASAMAQASMHLMLVSLNIVDIPLGYNPPRGPSVQFRATYNQRDTYWPTWSPNYSNLGYKWTFDWFSYITDYGTGGSDPVTRYVSGGGQLTYKSPIGGVYDPDLFGGILSYYSAGGEYELKFADGSKQVFGQRIGSSRIYLTEVHDAVGNALLISYDGQGRISHVNDDLGQTTTLHYDHPGDDYKITSVEDPFGRFAYFEYDQVGRLTKMTDVEGMSSSFSYDSGDFIKGLTTPYGTTSFTFGESGYTRWLHVTDPEGGEEYAQSMHDASDYVGAMELEIPTLPQSAPGPLSNFTLDHRNTFYFGKKAMSEIGGVPSSEADFDNATIYHWCWDNITDPLSITSGFLESFKPPMESRVWYLYPGQINGTKFLDGVTLRKPVIVARLVDTPSGVLSEIHEFTYNARGNITTYTDPLGRETTLDYYTVNNVDTVDLHKVRQTTGSMDELLAEFGTYNAQHRPATYTDAALQTSTLAWNGKGQIQQVTNPNSEVTRFVYDTGGDGYLEQVERDWDDGGSPATKTTSLTYDGFGRVRTVVDVSDNYTLTYDYDALNRQTRVTYPDSTFEQYDYDRLDLIRTWDRAGRRTQIAYDNVGRPLSVKDHLNRVTSFSWCGCGSLESITDPMNHTTTWLRDIQGRVTKKLYHDSKEQNYTYHPRSGRLKSVTDAKAQIKTYGYNEDGTLKTVTYSGDIIPTADLSLTYDPDYRRTASLTDGTGVTSFDYHPVTSPTATLGANRLKSVDGPLSGQTDLILYNYDALGRVLSRAIGTVGESYVYDDLGRITEHASQLGTLLYDYVGDSGRLDTLSSALPNRPSTSFDYFNNLGEFRLKQILNKKGSGATLSKFDYQYDVLGRIQQWTQQADASTPNVMDLEYDSEGQLLNALITQGGSPAKGFTYAYDLIGNRTSEQIDSFSPSQASTVTEASHYTVNQLWTLSGTGSLPVRFRGTVDEPATVTVNSQSTQVNSDPASATGGQIFTATVDLTAGSKTVPVVATDYGAPPNVTTKNYSVEVAGGEARTYSYDNNGNPTGYTSASGNVSYEWDAEDRLVAVVQGSLRSEFTYDGFGRRVKIVEKTGAGAPSTRLFLWHGLQLAEERDGNNNVLKRFYAEGVMDYIPNAGPYFYMFDHLGSVRELTDSSGTIRARYDYDPYGRRTKLSGDMEADFGFTGHYYHATSGLHLAPYRAYDADLGRWLNRDPIAEAGGLNLYGYAANNPVNHVDPLGLEVSVGDHSISGTKHHHTFIKITPENQDRYTDPDLWVPDENGVKSLTLGAGPEKNKLKSGPNRETDAAPHSQGQYTGVELPKDCSNEDEFIDRLLQQEDNYDDGLDYDTLPSLPKDQKWWLPDDGHNSNSYVSGMLDAAGATPPEIDYYSVPGYNKPVPREHFQKP